MSNCLVKCCSFWWSQSNSLCCCKAWSDHVANEQRVVESSSQIPRDLKPHKTFITLSWIQEINEWRNIWKYRGSQLWPQWLLRSFLIKVSSTAVFQLYIPYRVSTNVQCVQSVQRLQETMQKWSCACFPQKIRCHLNLIAGLIPEMPFWLWNWYLT